MQVAVAVLLDNFISETAREKEVCARACVCMLFVLTCVCVRASMCRCVCVRVRIVRVFG